MSLNNVCSILLNDFVWILQKMKEELGQGDTKKDQEIILRFLKVLYNWHIVNIIVQMILIVCMTRLCYLVSLVFQHYTGMFEINPLWMLYYCWSRLSAGIFSYILISHAPNFQFGKWLGARNMTIVRLPGALRFKTSKGARAASQTRLHLAALPPPKTPARSGGRRARSGGRRGRLWLPKCSRNECKMDNEINLKNLGCL